MLITNANSFNIRRKNKGPKSKQKTNTPNAKQTMRSQRKEPWFGGVKYAWQH
jgi:hypothetical protein